MIIDTNFYSALYRGEARAVEQLRGANIVHIPLFVVGELSHGFVKGGRTDKNEATLADFLARPEVRLLMPTLITARFFGEIAALCDRSGRALSQNDIWIAALAHEHQLPIATFDKDFLFLTSLEGYRVRVVD